MPKVFRVSVVYEMYGVYYIYADSENEAKRLALSNSRPLPENSCYVDDSIKIDSCEHVKTIGMGGKK